MTNEEVWSIIKTYMPKDEPMNAKDIEAFKDTLDYEYVGGIIDDESLLEEYVVGETLDD